MKKMVMFFTFSLCALIGVSASNENPMDNGQKKVEQVGSAISAKVRLSKVAIKESETPLLTIENTSVNLSDDGESGKDKAKKSGKCQNGSGNCKPGKE